MDQTTEYALELINKVRQAFGITPLSEMPIGVPGDPCRCPTARALNPCGSSPPVIVGNIMFSSSEAAAIAERAMQGKRINLSNPRFVVPPDDLSRFIENFDKGVYPELVEVT